ncbi:MAG: hypothetical protein HYU30_08320 [Chloroflexi bacterium]|nr:hypothetical protein [Chloroflexota bacterium]
MQERLEIGTMDIGRIRLRLHQRLKSLEADKEGIERDILETKRRLGVLEDLAAWEFPQEATDSVTAITPVDQARLNGHAKLLVLPLGKAIESLRLENPAITKKEARRILDEIGYRYDTEGPNVGRSIHAAWIAANRYLKEHTGGTSP